MSPGENDYLEDILEGCVRKKRKSQKRLYDMYYHFGFSICRRYAKNREEAEEMVNNSFLKIFLNIEKFDRKMRFESWSRRIFVNSAIDYYRKYINDSSKSQFSIENHGLNEKLKINPVVLAKLSAEDILSCLEQLSPANRAVFNLYVIEGYSHAEIADILHISTGTSKSNLFKAREKLKYFLAKLNV